MPCNSVAVLRARLSAGVFETISQDARGIEALRAWLQQQTGRVVTVRTTTPGFVAFDVGFDTITLSTSELTLMGRVPGVTPEQLNAFTLQLSVALQQDQLVSAIQSSAYVASDGYDAAGNRVLVVSA